MSKDYVLVVDDHCSVRQLLCVFLLQEGFCVKEASDCGTAIQIFREAKPKLVFLDLKMPWLSGMETLNKLKQSSPQTPIVVMSTCSRDNALVCTIKNSQIEYFVHKPFDLDNLRFILHALLNNPREASA